jgi:hypothetical protein
VRVEWYHAYVDETGVVMSIRPGFYVVYRHAATQRVFLAGNQYGGPLTSAQDAQDNIRERGDLIDYAAIVTHVDLKAYRPSKQSIDQYMGI